MKIKDEVEFAKVNIFGLGDPNNNYAAYFIGQSYLKILTDPKIAGELIANVTFEPGCRNNWHCHNTKKGAGQILMCIAGEGWYQEEGKAPISFTPGMVITVPSGVKHWHGAKKDSWFSHLATSNVLEAIDNEWFEPVDDEYYNNLTE